MQDRTATARWILCFIGWHRSICVHEGATKGKSSGVPGNSPCLVLEGCRTSSFARGETSQMLALSTPFALPDQLFITHESSVEMTNSNSSDGVGGESDHLKQINFVIIENELLINPFVPHMRPLNGSEIGERTQRVIHLGLIDIIISRCGANLKCKCANVNEESLK